MKRFVRKSTRAYTVSDRNQGNAGAKMRGVARVYSTTLISWPGCGRLFG